MVGYVFMLAIGVVALVAGMRLEMKIAGIRRWPTTAGRWTRKEIALRSAAVAADSPGRRWQLEVSYTYPVNGVVYTGTRVYPYIHVYRIDEARKELAALPDEPTISYDPMNPGESYLYSGNLAWPRLAIGLGFVFAMLGLLMVLFG